MDGNSILEYTYSKAVKLAHHLWFAYKTTVFYQTNNCPTNGLKMGWLKALNYVFYLLFKFMNEVKIKCKKKNKMKFINLDIFVVILFKIISFYTVLDLRAYFHILCVACLLPMLLFMLCKYYIFFKRIDVFY